jgi:hypothetical protein
MSENGAASHIRGERKEITRSMNLRVIRPVPLMCNRIDLEGHQSETEGVRDLITSFAYMW